MGQSNEVVVLARCAWGDPSQAEWDTFWSMGDVNRDGYINQTDADLITANICYTPGCNPEYDINGDGIVDMSDLSICEYNFGKDICTYFGRRDTNLTLQAPVSAEPDVSFKLTGKLTAVDTGEAIPSAEILLWRTLGTAEEYEIIATAYTDVNGDYEFTETLSINMTAKYTTAFGGNETFMGC